MINLNEAYDDYITGNIEGLTKAQKAILNAYTMMIDTIEDMDELLIITEHLERAYNSICRLEEFRSEDFLNKVRKIVRDI